jgi:hypothetical protein
MSAKVFPETNFIPPSDGQSGKFLSTDGQNLLWNYPYDSQGFIYTGSSSGLIRFTNIPKCNTIILLCAYSASMTTQTLTFNGDSGTNYTYSYSAFNGSSSSSGTGNTINTSASNITLATAFGSLSSVQQWIRIDGCSSSGQKTITSAWQDGAGNGTTLGTWNNLQAINDLLFNPGSTSYQYRIVGY